MRDRADRRVSRRPGKPLPDTVNLRPVAARFAPTDIGADLSKLPATERRARTPGWSEARPDRRVCFCARCGPATRPCCSIWRRTGRRRARAAALLPDQQGTVVAARSRRGVRAGAPAKPAGANFYPTDASKAELERWIQSLPDAERTRANGFFTTVRRAGGSFSMVPYNVEYQAELARAAALLREAAALSANRRSRRF